MSIDGRGSSPSRQAQDRIEALVSENERLKAAAGQAKAFVAEQAKRYAAELSEVIGERDRARSTAVDFEQQIDKIRAGLVAAAGDVRSFPERHTDEYVRGQYETLLAQLADVLEITGEHYPEKGSAEAAEELAAAFASGTLDHAGQMLPEALDLDDEAREEALRDEYRSIGGYVESEVAA
jgi:hypothetical protein